MSFASAQLDDQTSHLPRAVSSQLRQGRRALLLFANSPHPVTYVITKPCMCTYHVIAVDTAKDRAIIEQTEILCSDCLCLQKAAHTVWKGACNKNKRVPGNTTLSCRESCVGRCDRTLGLSMDNYYPWFKCKLNNAYSVALYVSSWHSMVGQSIATASSQRTLMHHTKVAMTVLLLELVFAMSAVY